MNTVTMAAQLNHDPYVSRISRTVEDIMSKEDVFRERLHQATMIQLLAETMNACPPEEFLSMKDADFRRYIGKIMANQLAYGIWGDEGSFFY